MSERKVLNKYYPPDFDPTKLPRLRRGENFSYKVRLMAPFSMRCNTCGEWIHKGKKFNAKKEDAHGEKYLGIQIYRFYIRCPRCSAEVSFKTDPENTDYICEAGASRNFEPWRDQAREKEEIKKEKEEQEENNPMKALENRTEDSKREIQNLDALDEIRAINSIKETTSVDEVIKRLVAEGNYDPEALQDELKVKEVFEAREQFVRRIDEDEAETVPKVQFFASKKTPGDTLVSEAPPKKPKTANLLGLVVKKPKTPATPAPAPAPADTARAAKEASVAGPSVAVSASAPAPATGGLAGLVAYSDDDGDD